VRKKGPRELYDLVADPSERHDLAAEHPEVVERLAALAAADAAGDAKAVPEDLKDLPH
jgi:arylsulfatase A-like enzyme